MDFLYYEMQQKQLTNRRTSSKKTSVWIQDIILVSPNRPSSIIFLSFHSCELWSHPMGLLPVLLNCSSFSFLQRVQPPPSRVYHCPCKRCYFLKTSLMANLGIISLCFECLFHIWCCPCWKYKNIKEKVMCISSLYPSSWHTALNPLTKCLPMNEWMNRYICLEMFVFRLYDYISIPVFVKFGAFDISVQIILC